MFRSFATRCMLRGTAMLTRAGMLILLGWLAGCASVYFHDAGPAPADGLQYTPSSLPYAEYWTGIVFNGDKIGFTRFSIRAARGTLHEITSKASFVLRFMGIEKKVHLRARDVVDHKLQLHDFSYDYHIDGSELLISGKRNGGTLDVSVVTGGQPVQQRYPVREPLYPTSVIALYPVVAGLQVGRSYRYQVYDGQLQKLATVEQRAEAYEASDLFAGKAFRVTTTLHGQRTTTWIDGQGRPVFELAMRGVMISALEDAARARQYVALAAVNQRETLVEFSLIRPDRPVRVPREVEYLRLVLEGLERPPPGSSMQRCRAVPSGHECEIRSPGTVVPRDSKLPAVPLRAYLEPSATVQSRYPNIRIAASQIAGDADDPMIRLRRLLRWMDTNIEKAPIDVFSAIDVLEEKKAECQGHAYLFAAFARALGIPTRVVSGLAYSEQFGGFLFHSWVESQVHGQWHAIDPTFGQASADATHVKLLEGDAVADLLPLLDWVGRLRIRVLAAEYRTP